MADAETGTTATETEEREGERDWMDRVLARVDRVVGWTASHVRETREWMRDQPPARLITLALGALAAVIGAWLLLWLLVSILSAAAGALFGADEAAAPAPAPKPPPAWLAEIQHVGLWDRVFASVSAYADSAGPAAATPGWLLLAIWVGIGVAALLGSWLGTGGRWLVTTLVWWGWLAASAWVIWTSTPAANPVPAVLIVALGVLIAAQPWTVLLVAPLVIIGAM